MDNPFKYINDSFRDRFEVRFVIERMDGSLTLALSDDHGVVARRPLSAEQLGDRRRLERAIQAIHAELDAAPQPVLFERASASGEERICSG